MKNIKIRFSRLQDFHLFCFLLVSFKYLKIGEVFKTRQVI